MNTQKYHNPYFTEQTKTGSYNKWTRTASKNIKYKYIYKENNKLTT